MLTHISNNFFGSKVHSQLVAALDKRAHGDLKQAVFCPQQKSFQDNFMVDSSERVVIWKRRVLRQWIRYLPLFKVLYVFVWFCSFMRKHGRGTGFIVAHNLWSDGSIAYLYHLFTGTPYSVAVRNTDVNHFIAKLPHYRWLMRRIVSNAERCVFINPSYQKHCKKKYPRLFSKEGNQEVIYNGIDSYWHENSIGHAKPEQIQVRPMKAVYVGTFIKRKNLQRIVPALQQCRDQLPLEFVVIGGSEEEFLLRTGLKTVPEWITVIPRTNDRNLIREHLRASRVFVMPSWNETFGLVYFEAFSQGCAVVHTRNDGVDGVVDETFFKGVGPTDIDEIASAVVNACESYSEGIAPEKVEKYLPQFDWNRIAEQYLEFITPHLMHQKVNEGL